MRSRSIETAREYFKPVPWWKRWVAATAARVETWRRSLTHEPRELSVNDFKVPRRYAIAVWLEKWGLLLVLGATGLALLAGYVWLTWSGS